MPSESGDQRRQGRLQHVGGLHPPESEPEHLPCPRCDSTNTKFCYYNNYNLSQPRHFCKSCRRYWTRGGTLRNVPVGGGTRRNPLKRSRTVAATSSCSSSSAAAATHDPVHANPISLLPVAKSEATATSFCSDVNLNESYDYETVPALPGTFTSLLAPQGGAGLFALGGYGLDSGPGLREMEFGLGMGVWPMEEISGGSGGCGGEPGAAWQMGGGAEGGLTDSDCFGWPDLAISTPGKALK